MILALVPIELWEKERGGGGGGGGGGECFLIMLVGKALEEANLFAHQTWGWADQGYGL